ncbi:hypothetical protein TorRG33x02_239370, partial [Trema orientale]
HDVEKIWLLTSLVTRQERPNCQATSLSPEKGASTSRKKRQKLAHITLRAKRRDICMSSHRARR